MVVEQDSRAVRARINEGGIGQRKIGLFVYSELIRFVQIEVDVYGLD